MIQIQSLKSLRMSGFACKGAYIAIIALVAVLIGPVNPALAQSGGGRGGAQPSAGQSSEPRISLTFKGGSAVQFIEAVRKESRQSNIIVKPKVEMVVIPQIELQDVSVRSAVMLLDDFRQEIDGGMVVLDVDIIQHMNSLGVQPGGGVSDQPAPIYVVNAMISSYRSPGENAMGSQVWTIQELLLGAFTSDDVIAAVETAIPLVEDDESLVQMRFHEETAILIARAPGQTLEVIDNVLSELQRAAHIREGAQQRKRREADQARELQEQLEHMEQLSVERSAALDEIQHFRMRMTEMEVQRSALENEIARMRQLNAELRQQVNDLQMALMQANEERRAAEERGRDGGGGGTGGSR